MDPNLRREHSIVVVLKNGVADTLRTVQSIIGTTEPDVYEVIFVDNATTDETPKLLESFGGDVRVIRKTTPLGYAEACNEGFADSSGDFVTFLPAGAELQPNWRTDTRPLFDSEPRLGAVGMPLYNGQSQRRALRIVEYAPDELQLDWVAEPANPDLFFSPSQVKVLGLWGTTFRRETLGKIGAFNAMAYADLAAADFCLRAARDLGMAVALQPSTALIGELPDVDGARALTPWRGSVTAEVSWARVSGAPAALAPAFNTDPRTASAFALIAQGMQNGDRIGGLPMDAAEVLYERMMFEEEHRLLQEMRAGRDVCWPDEGDPEPLVTLFIPTYQRLSELMDLAIPSCLNQTYENIELLVVGDRVDENFVKHMEGIKDPRFRFVNLGARGIYPADARHRWMVAGVNPINVGNELARGTWWSRCDDDDEFTLDHVEVLLNHARQNRLEMVWSKADMEFPDGWRELGSTPLALGNVAQGSAMYSMGLRFMRMSLTSWKTDEPTDANLWRRMATIGARCGFLDRVTYKHYLEGPYRDPAIAPRQP